MDKDYADAIMWACSEANAGLFQKIREDEKMFTALREIMKDELEKEWKQGEEEGLKKGMEDGMMQTLYAIVQDGDMPIERAAKRAGQGIFEFAVNMSNAGYIVPNNSI